jgi:hypothetical protein
MGVYAAGAFQFGHYAGLTSFQLARGDSKARSYALDALSVAQKQANILASGSIMPSLILKDTLNARGGINHDAIVPAREEWELQIRNTGHNDHANLYILGMFIGFAEGQASVLDAYEETAKLGKEALDRARVIIKGHFSTHCRTYLPFDLSLIDAAYDSFQKNLNVTAGDNSAHHRVQVVAAAYYRASLESSVIN